MPGLPTRRKAIALNAISSPTDSVIYPSGSYCIPPGTDQEILVADSSTATGFGWQTVDEVLSSGSSGLYGRNFLLMGG